MLKKNGDRYKQKKVPLYTPAHFYMLRNPMLPATVFSEMVACTLDDELLDEELSDYILTKIQRKSYEYLDTFSQLPIVKQALVVASLSIYEGLERVQKYDISSRRMQRLYSRLLRYLIRMSTRATPFGLFSGISIGRFADTTNIQLENVLATHHIHARTDMNWLFSLIQQIEIDKNIVSHTSLSVNHTSYLSGDRVIIPYVDIYGQNDTRSITLRATLAVKYVWQMARQPIFFQELQEKLHAKLPSASSEEVEGFLFQLWEQHFLISDLRPPLTVAEPAKYILAKLKSLQDISSPSQEQIESILCQIDHINKNENLSSDNLLEQFIQLHTQTTSPVSEQLHKQAFQVDVSFILKQSNLQRSIGIAAAQAAELLLRLGSFPQGLPHIRAYHSAFIERYGLDTEVPLLELLSPELGLDAPDTYTQPPRSYPLPFAPPEVTATLDPALSSLLLEAVNNHQMEVELTDSMLHQLTKWDPSGPIPPPPSLDIYLQIQAQSLEALAKDEWRVVLSPHPISPGGRTFGRFFDILTPDELDTLRSYVKAEETLLPDKLFAELSYPPLWAHGANIAVKPMFRSYEIAVNTTPSLPSHRVIALSDLVIGADIHRFYVRSLSMGKEIVPCQSHMLNPLYAPNVCRFLLEIANDGYPTLSPFDWGALRSMPFLPRIVYGKIVLSLARWNIDASVIDPCGLGSDELRWFRGLQKWREQWRVPRYVYLLDDDNRLLLDLEHPLIATELRAELQKLQPGTLLILQEVTPNLNDLWLRDTANNAFLSEIVIPLLRSSSSTSVSHLQFGVDTSHHTSTLFPSTVRRQIPGGEWTFLKLYCTQEQQEEIIIEPLREIASALLKQNLIDQWFFVRYADPEPHLRVRFHATSPLQAKTILCTTLDWSNQLVQKGIIYRICIDEYIQEIERYGGLKALKVIETFFTIDSDIVSQLLMQLHNQDIQLDEIAISIFCIKQLFTDWGYNNDDCLSYLKNLTEKYQESKLFRSQKQLLCELLFPLSTTNTISIKEQRDLLLSAFSAQKEPIENIVQSINILAEGRELVKSKEAIVYSLAHMRLNRLLGADREKEMKVYSLLRSTLENMQRRPL